MAKSSVLCMVIFRREITIQEYLSAQLRGYFHALLQRRGEESMRYCLLYQQYARTLISATGVESHGELRLGIVAPAATCAGEIRRKSETNSSW